MSKRRAILAELLNFIFFYIFYGFCIGLLTYLALTSETVDMGRAESLRYAVYIGLIVSPMVYIGVQISERKERKQKRLQEKLRVEIRKFVQDRK
jgi:Na+/proline symporter